MMNKNTLLVTGGAGYIGSHTCVVLLQAGWDVVVVDNLCNSSRQALDRVQEISGRSLSFHQVDIRDKASLARILDLRDELTRLWCAGRTLP